jgi:hypothetical protein
LLSQAVLLSLITPRPDQYAAIQIRDVIVSREEKAHLKSKDEEG